MNPKGYLIFLLCEFFCFGLLEQLNKWFLEGNLQAINIYINDYKSASQTVIILPILFGLILLFLLLFWYKRDNMYVYISIVGIFTVYLLHLYIISSMKDHAYTFEIHYLSYFFPLVLLWFGVYILHIVVEGMFPENKI
jgi:hypothetical protein